MQMEISTKESFGMIKRQGKECLFLLMETDMKDKPRMEKKMEKVFLFGKVVHSKETDMKEIGKMI